MIRTKDQLPNEATYPHLSKFLCSGGTLRIGESQSLGGFARMHIRNTTVVVSDVAYRDLAAVLKEMDAQARNYFERQP